MCCCAAVEGTTNKQVSNATPSIFNWSDADVWEYIHTRKIPILFTRGLAVYLSRCGKGMLRDAERWPKYNISAPEDVDKKIDGFDVGADPGKMYGTGG